MDTQFIARVEETLAQIHKTLIASISEAVRQHPQRETGEGGDVVVFVDGVYYGTPEHLADSTEISKLILCVHGLYFCVGDSGIEIPVSEIDNFQTLIGLYRCVAQQEVA